MNISELAALTGGRLASGIDGSKVVRGVASLAEAAEGDITFLGSPQYRPLLTTCTATVALVPEDFAHVVPPILIRCEHPAMAFAKVLEAFAPPPIELPRGIHPTAIIGKDVILGANVNIQAYSVIEDRAVIGERTTIGAHAYIGQDVQVGDDCFFHPRVTIMHRCTVGHRAIFHSGVVIGADGFGFEFRDGKHVKVPQNGIVEVGNDVEMGANTCVDRARFGRTAIGDGSKLDNLVQIGHNVRLGNHDIICAQVGIAGSVRLGSYVTIAGKVGINGHITIGDKAMVGGFSGVVKSLAPNGIYIGFPAVPAQEWKEQLVYMRQIGPIKKRLEVVERFLRDSGKNPPPQT
jgi:UDP-3-O-[3-hydroxymyristoyl] glucosamine N-acyltransferase